MDNASYVALSRQSGLSRALDTVANNLANMGTAGFRREDVTFAEIVRDLKAEGGSVALTAARARHASQVQGALRKTDGTFDIAIEGPGFFQVETPDGVRLTRAGAFLRNSEAELVTPDGHRLLDAGGAPIFVPPDARSISIGGDGTVLADGAPVTGIGLVTTDAPAGLERVGDTLFRPNGPIVPVEDGRMIQGYLEGSNVNPVAEITRMIEVQRAYEANQRLLDREDERISRAIETITRRN